MTSLQIPPDLALRLTSRWLCPRGAKVALRTGAELTHSGRRFWTLSGAPDALAATLNVARWAERN